MAKTDNFRNRAAACEAHDDVPRSPAEGETIGDVILGRYSRREVMRGTLGVAAAASLFGPVALAAGQARAETTPGLSTSRRSPRASTTPIMSRAAIAPRSCSDGAIRSFPIHPPSIRKAKARLRN